ncbi:hypothetical protein AAFF_G00285410 [Aldrovandia affinis]|uniref:Uncharacterized protein n=1 Tax=Aldrovandia affinis TaxID=143900 RepID=A0AAD7X2R6_9TELE|nr:hypothetical protein AAFF_G00285410 [Aldrovandia affinis]
MFGELSSRRPDNGNESKAAWLDKGRARPELEGGRKGSCPRITILSFKEATIIEPPSRGPTCPVAQWAQGEKVGQPARVSGSQRGPRRQGRGPMRSRSRVTPRCRGQPNSQPNCRCWHWAWLATPL